MAADSVCSCMRARFSSSSMLASGEAVGDTSVCTPESRLHE